MSMIAAMLEELEQEAQTTKRVLERVPEGKLGWKPHERSMSLGQLALHVAMVPGAVAQLATQSPLQVPSFARPDATSAAALLPALEQSIATARAVLQSMDEAALAKPWTVVDGDREVMTIPVGTLLRSIMLNHWYHHRGQLSVYLREVGEKVPSIYGPSADENPFAPQTAAAAAR